jgi:hypothetical protein
MKQYDLVINGINYNQELDQLQEYLRQMVEYSSPIKIKMDISSSWVPSAEQLKKTISLFKEQGILFVNKGL